MYHFQKPDLLTLNPHANVPSERLSFLVRYRSPDTKLHRWTIDCCVCVFFPPVNVGSDQIFAKQFSPNLNAAFKGVIMTHNLFLFTVIFFGNYSSKSNWSFCDLLHRDGLDLFYSPPLFVSAAPDDRRPRRRKPR